MDQEIEARVCEFDAWCMQDKLNKIRELQIKLGSLGAPGEGPEPRPVLPAGPSVATSFRAEVPGSAPVTGLGALSAMSSGQSTAATWFVVSAMHTYA